MVDISPCLIPVPTAFQLCSIPSKPVCAPSPYYPLGVGTPNAGLENPSMHSRAGPVPRNGIMRKTALAYAEIGYAVFPLAPGTKVPGMGSRGVRDATRDFAQIDRWWTKTPAANIGIACGQESGIVVVDVDHKMGVSPGLSNWAKLIEEQCQVGLRGPVAVTPSGGLHLVFAFDARVTNTVGRIAGGIDTRGSGGYIVAAPSVINGQAYCWKSSPRLARSPVPEWVAERCLARQHVLHQKAETRRSANQKNFNPIGLISAVRMAPAGTRNAKLFWAACKSVQAGGAGLDAIASAALEAGLPDWEIRKTIGSAVKRVSSAER
jgi:hypothetical protein